MRALTLRAATAVQLPLLAPSASPHPCPPPLPLQQPAHPQWPPWECGSPGPRSCTTAGHPCQQSSGRSCCSCSRGAGGGAAHEHGQHANCANIAAIALQCCRAPGMPSVPARGGRALGCLRRCQASKHAVHTAQHRCPARCAPPQALHGFWQLLTRAARPAAAGTPSRSAENKRRAVRAAARGPGPGQRCSDGAARSPGQPWRRLKGPLTLSSRKRTMAAPQAPQMSGR
jgi:hypothetical protein